MITVKNLSIQLGDFTLEDISFEVPKGHYAVLMGKTGSGKTTILEAICGLKKVKGGQVKLGGDDVTNLRPGDRFLGYVPQDGVLFSTMSVREQIAFGPLVRGWKKSDAHLRVDDLSAQLGIDHLLNRKSIGLSGGERQRIALARALAAKPRVICLDEPLSSLDEETRDHVCELIIKLHKLENFTVLHITHSAAEAERLGDEIFKIDAGKITIVNSSIK